MPVSKRKKSLESIQSPVPISDSASRKCNYKDLCTWPEDQRWELIDGVAYDMTPPPLRVHQEISGNLNEVFRAFFKGKPCKVYYAPFGVRLPDKNEPDEELRTVVEPDLVVVCDESKLDEKGCRGAPDLVVEILSPSTASKDHVKKKNLYERHGVKEYWLIDPVNRLVTIYRQTGKNTFGPAEIFDHEAKLKVPLFPGLTIDFSDVFPPDTRIVKEGPRKFQI